MNFDGSSNTKLSHMGAFLTIIQFTIVCMFSVSKFLTWSTLDDVNIFQAVQRQKIDHTTTFSPEQGFYMAAGITEYDNNPEIIEEAKYGELTFEYYSWDGTL